MVWGLRGMVGSLAAGLPVAMLVGIGPPDPHHYFWLLVVLLLGSWIFFGAIGAGVGYTLNQVFLWYRKAQRQ